MKNPLSNNYSEEENLILIDKVQEGDSTALDKLVNIHQSFIYNVAWKMTHSNEDALDLTQEVLIKVITKLSTFKRESAFKTWHKISEIKKNDIGSTRYVWAHHASNWEPWSNPWTEATQNGVNMVFWNTFERDWNRSSKQIGTCSASGTTIYLAGNMRFSSEWYSWIPSTANIHFTRFEWIYNDWAHWNSSWKAKFRLWRV